MIDSRNASECSHPALISSLCVKCGKRLTPAEIADREQCTSDVNDSNGSDITSKRLLVAGGRHLTLSKNEAISLQKSKEQSLRIAQKLDLVLDIDHTLLHATTAWDNYQETFKSVDDIRVVSVDDGNKLFTGRSSKYLLKFRPHLLWFLQEANKMFRLSIYTAGTRPYAEAVVKAMDPQNKYFQQRIVSRSDTFVNTNAGSAMNSISSSSSNRNNNTTPPVSLHALGREKSLDRIMSDLGMAIILDDTEDVWKGKQAGHLLLVKPFHFFLGLPEVNNSAGILPVVVIPSLSNILSENDILTSISKITESVVESSVKSEPQPTVMSTPTDDIVSSTSIQQDQPQNSILVSTDNLVVTSSQPDELLSINLEKSKIEVQKQNVVLLAGDRPGMTMSVEIPISTTSGNDCYNKLAVYDDQLPRILCILQEIHRRFYGSTDSNDITKNEELIVGVEPISSTKVDTILSDVTIVNRNGISIDDTRSLTPPSNKRKKVSPHNHQIGPTDVSVVIRDMKKEVLAGCSIAFSGVIPINTGTPSSMHYVWRLAEALGAVVTSEVTSHTSKGRIVGRSVYWRWGCRSKMTLVTTLVYNIKVRMVEYVGCIY